MFPFEDSSSADQDVNDLILFIEDIVPFARMFYLGGAANSVHGADFQAGMVAMHPRGWMEWLFREIGWFDPYPYPDTEYTERLPEPADEQDPEWDWEL